MIFDTENVALFFLYISCNFYFNLKTLLKLTFYGCVYGKKACMTSHYCAIVHPCSISALVSIWKRLASRRGTHYVLWPYVLRRNRKRLFSIARQPRPAILYISTILFERFHRDLSREYMRARAVLNHFEVDGYFARGLTR